MCKFCLSSQNVFINEAVNGVTWAVMSSFLCDGDTTGQVNSHVWITPIVLNCFHFHLTCVAPMNFSLSRLRKSDKFW